jgi:hypothetical protein
MSQAIIAYYNKDWKTFTELYEASLNHKPKTDLTSSMKESDTSSLMINQSLNKSSQLSNEPSEPRRS